MPRRDPTDREPAVGVSGKTSGTTDGARQRPAAPHRPWWEYAAPLPHPVVPFGHRCEFAGLGRLCRHLPVGRAAPVGASARRVVPRHSSRRAIGRAACGRSPRARPFFAWDDRVSRRPSTTRAPQHRSSIFPGRFSAEPGRSGQVLWIAAPGVQDEGEPELTAETLVVAPQLEQRPSTALGGKDRPTATSVGASEARVVGKVAAERAGNPAETHRP